MESDDDPEAYIRELERQLEDAARASELGLRSRPAGPFPPPPRVDRSPAMPAPWYSDGSYPMPAPPPDSRQRRGLVLFVVGGIAAAGIVTLVALATSLGDVFSGVQSMVESPSPGQAAPATDGPRDGVSPAPPTVPVLPVGPGGESPAAVAPGGEFSIAGVGGHRTVLCDGGAVRVSGVSNTVEITGRCNRVEVSGVQNTVTVDSADLITASGFNNRVTYLSGEPRVERSGQGNTVGPR